MRLSKTTEKEIDSLMDLLIEVERFHDNDRFNNLSNIDWSEYEILSKFDHENYETMFDDLIKHISNIHFKRILSNCTTLLENCADPNLDYLEFNPDIKMGLELLKTQKKDNV
jgi:hypothetical protein